MISMIVRLSEVVFLRLSAGDPSWLAELRWPDPVLAMIDQDRALAASEARLAAGAAAFEDQFSAGDWAALQSWRHRAAARAVASAPRLLDVHPEAAQMFHRLIAVTRARRDAKARLEAAIDEAEVTIEERALVRQSELVVDLMIANASADLAADLARLRTSPSSMSRKDRRHLARTVWSYLARGTYKSCPLAFAADTGVLVVRAGERTRVRVDSRQFVVIRPNQELCNELVRTLRPVDACLASGKLFPRLSVAADPRADRVLVWRTARSGNVVRETLVAVCVPPAARGFIELATERNAARPWPPGLTNNDRAVVARLFDEGVLVRDDLVTPVTEDPWTLVAHALTSGAPTPCNWGADTITEAGWHVARFAHPVAVTAATGAPISSALASLRQLGDAVLGTEKLPSAFVSMDTYRPVTGDICRGGLDAVGSAITQYLILGGLAYPATPTCRRRQAFVDQFRGRYGDGRPLRLESMLIDDWSSIDRSLSFLLDPGDSPVHPDNDLVWPEPDRRDGGDYARLWRALMDAAGSSATHYEISPILTDPQILWRSQPVIDVVCRLSRDHHGGLDVFVESATLAGRLVARHLDTLGNLDPAAAEAVDRYRSQLLAMPAQPRVIGATLVPIVASHTIPRLQNLSRIPNYGDGPVLAITEPAPHAGVGTVMRYSELYVRFDADQGSFVITRGPDGGPLHFSWPSPLSPSFSRRLHLLRFLELATAPVITTPRWLPFEATTGGHLPSITVGRLVLCPQRWSFPLAAFAACAEATGPRRHIIVRSLRRDLGLPDEVFVCTAHDTRPAFIDFASPFGTDVFLRLLRKGRRDGAATILIEERFPQPGREIVESPSGSASMIFQCTLRPDDPEGHHADRRAA